MSICPTFGDGGPSGIAEALRVVDCMSGEAASFAFARLFGTDAVLGQALTAALTLYIAFYAIGLLTGRASLSLSSLTPRMMTLGVALTFATSWIAYQSVIWNLLVGAPDQIASLLIGARGSATELFADRLDKIFGVVAQAAAATEAATAPLKDSGSLASGPDLLWLSALLLLLGTVGVLLVARIALAAMLALGPIFIIFGLFDGTRGMFEGWLKAAVLFALTLTRTDDMRTVPVGIQLLMGQHSYEWNQMMAMSILGSIPVLILFLLFQRRFIGGLTSGAVKS